MKNNKAFTLVELMAVITIIAILGTMAFITLEKPKCKEQGLIKGFYGGCETQESYNINKIKRDISYCTNTAKNMINGTMSDTWGNDEYNTAPPSKLMETIYNDCMNKITTNEQ